MRVGDIVGNLEILEPVLVDRRGATKNSQLGQRLRLAGQLLPRLLEMVRVEMAIAAGPDERSRLEIALLGQHVGQQGIAGDVERNAEKNVGAPLIQLKMKLSARHLGLKQAMAGSQRHEVQFRRVPGTDDLTTGGWVLLDQFDQLRDLVDLSPVRRLPAAPLFAVDGTKIAI